MGNEHFAGMTLNERLLEMEILESFDAAARARDRVRMVDLLRSVTLDTEDAETIVDLILDDPATYGFQTIGRLLSAARLTIVAADERSL